ncbi:hypothetical protein LIAUS_18010 [Leptospira interrogans]
MGETSYAIIPEFFQNRDVLFQRSLCDAIRSFLYGLNKGSS